MSFAAPGGTAIAINVVTFQNISLLVALAAVGIPIALHLIARKEPKQVLFPSVRLLTQRFETNRSKVRIRRWWLLALRIAAFAVVAFALARPAIAGSLSLTWSTIGILSVVGVMLLAMASVAANRPNQKTLVWSLLGAAAVALLAALGWGGYIMASGAKPEIDESTPIALAIVVDNPALAAWRTSDEDHLDGLRKAARELMLAVHPESRIALVDRSATPAAFALDRSSALSKIDALQPLEVVRPLESRIEAAARLLLTSEIGSRQLLVLSALPESSLSSEASGQGLANLIDEGGIRVTLWDMGQLVGVNRQVSIPTLSDTAPAPESTVTVAAVVSLESADGAEADQAGEAESLSVTAECVLFPSSPSLPVVRDGEILRPQAKPVDRINVELSPGRDVELQMTLPPLPVGLHHGAIRLLGEDALAIDDTSYFSIRVLPPSRLLLVSEQADEAEEIAWAVSAPAPIDDPSSQYAIEQIGYDDLVAARMEEFDGVILLDPPGGALGETELERYRASGGSVLLAVGDALGKERVEVAGWPKFQRRWRVPQPGSFLEISAPSHPSLFALASLPGGVPFQDFRVHQYWQTDPTGSGQVLMRYAGTNHAALVELDSQNNEQLVRPGRVLVLTTPIPALAPPNQSWNELFTADEYWPAFSLVRDLTRYITGRSAESWTSQVGTPVSLEIRNQGDTEDASRRLQWFPPVGTTPVPIDVPRQDVVPAGGMRRIVIGRPKHSGVHWVRGDEAGLGFSVNLPREQLAIARLDPARLQRLVGQDVFRQIESLKEMDWTATDGSQVVSLWSPIMLTALFVFMLEQVLGNRFYRRSSAAHASVSGGRTAA